MRCGWSLANTCTPHPVTALVKLASRSATCPYRFCEGRSLAAAALASFTKPSSGLESETLAYHHRAVAGGCGSDPSGWGFHKASAASPGHDGCPSSRLHPAVLG